MTQKRMLLVDRTRIEADWTCPRKRYWWTEYEGRGIVPATKAKALVFGIVVHEGLEQLPSQGAYRDQMHGLPEWAELGSEERKLAEALVTGFALEVWPEWEQNYEKVLVEQELEFELDGVLYMVRPDILLREKKTGDLWYPDFKTFGGGWNNRKWTHALQQHLTIVACERATGEPIIGSWIQGLAKGYTRNGTLYHLLVSGYRRSGSPGISSTAYSAKHRSGFERFDVREYEGKEGKGLKGWIQWLRAHEPEALSKIFPRTGPIFLKREMMNDFLHQRSYREEEIAGVAARVSVGEMSETEAMNRVFPQNFSACEPAFGTCPYLEACWVKKVREDPVGQGLYEYREPHHDAERKVMALQPV